jgi:hypothetical protein
MGAVVRRAAGALNDRRSAALRDARIDARARGQSADLRQRDAIFFASRTASEA